MMTRHLGGHRRLVRDSSGIAGVEYLIVAALVAVVALGAWAALGDGVEAKTRCAAGAIGGTSGDCGVAGAPGATAIASAPESRSAQGTETIPDGSAGPPIGSEQQVSIASSAPAMPWYEYAGNFALGFGEGFLGAAWNMVTGVWHLGVGLFHVVTHPVQSWNAVSGFLNRPPEEIGRDVVAAGKGILAGLIGGGLDMIARFNSGDPREAGRVTGAITFEVFTTVATAGGGSAVTHVDDVARVADAAADAAHAAELIGDAAHAADVVGDAAHAADLIGDAAHAADTIADTAHAADTLADTAHAADTASDAAHAAAEAEEGLAAAAIVRRYRSPNGTQFDLQVVQRNDEVIVAATSGDEVAGFYRISVNPPNSAFYNEALEAAGAPALGGGDVMMTRIEVSSAFRGEGLSRPLFDETLDQLAAHGGRHIVTFSEMGEQRMLQKYLAAGYEQISVNDMLFLFKDF